MNSRIKITGVSIALICMVAFFLATSTSPATLLISAISCVLLCHGMFSIYLMLHAWNDPRAAAAVPPRAVPVHSITALIPARHEADVIGETIKAIHAIRYPKQLKETIIVCQADDQETITAIKQAISVYKTSTYKLIIYDAPPFNKPHALNEGLKQTTGDIIVVFDAEDEPHPDIYTLANSHFCVRDTDVLQAGVQLMNFQSRWFSTLNVLEYFFWFKSALSVFAKLGVIPLGGNTVFFRSSILKSVEGWNTTCLTEDAEIGMRLSIAGARIRVAYDPAAVTREETPATLGDFIRQRTRWNMGFLQIYLQGAWKQLPYAYQRLIAAYILSWPLFQVILLAYAIMALYLTATANLPVITVILSLLPLYMVVMQYVISTVALYEFCESYGFAYPWWMPLKLLVTVYPFYIILGYSGLRAFIRLSRNNITWEKTTHVNLHRKLSKKLLLGRSI